MSASTDKVKKEAKAVEDKLRAADNHMDAEAIRRLRTGYSSALGTVLRQYMELQELRSRLKQLIEEAHGG